MNGYKFHRSIMEGQDYGKINKACMGIPKGNR